MRAPATTFYRTLERRGNLAPWEREQLHDVAREFQDVALLVAAYVMRSMRVRKIAAAWVRPSGSFSAT
jgi:hypothetical protein